MKYVPAIAGNFLKEYPTNTYKVLTATTRVSLEMQLNDAANRDYEIASVTGAFQVSIMTGTDPDTCVTAILRLTKAAQTMADSQALAEMQRAVAESG